MNAVAEMFSSASILLYTAHSFRDAHPTASLIAAISAAGILTLSILVAAILLTGENEIKTR